ncbi:MAG: N-6 DNA methylase, partial [Candidatus Nealsonbacteria bacterium]|nr:N-6 DNA methylase [Candidatus Nealsonbacteria bacterium]
TIDRTIFLRICEDRGIAPYGTLQGVSNGPKLYARLGELFRRADARYNSGLFYFTPEKGRNDPPDELTLGLAVDDKPLKEIIRHLYYPDSPYEFSVLPAEILGQVYEQFLGKVIRLTKGHQAKVEEKPEVRKAGGVYYTPKYIVDYIVEHTVGKLLEGKTPHEVGALTKTTWKRSKRGRPLTVLDPACGSGSFLIGAYQFLLDWHRDQYIATDPEQHARSNPPRLYRGPSGDWRLTTAEKKRILLSNIYGVDIDPQAVEVTKLSLLLKVLEGESEQTLSNQLRLFHERALPDLSSNIKCGNSLIGPDFYDNRQMSLLDEEERYRVNVFDWKAEFPSIFGGKIPGFDAVIGNPPWVMAGYYVGDELQYLTSHYGSATGKFDLYYLFVELGVRLLNEKGHFGMIVPNKFFHTGAARALRRQLSSQRFLHSIVDFGYERIFSGATNYSCILSLEQRPIDCIQFAQSLAGLSIVESYSVPWSELDDRPWYFVAPRKRSLFEKMEAVGTRLDTIVDRFGTGMQTGADRILALDAESAKECGIEQDILRPILRGRDVRRYQLGDKLKTVIFPYTEQGADFAIFDEPDLRAMFPVAYAYLDGNKKKLAKRVWFGKNAEQLSGQWYGMMYLDSCSAFRKPHLLTPSLSDQSNFSLGENLLFATGTAGVTSIIPTLDCVGLSYLLGILNSSLMSFYATSHSPVFQGGYFKFSAPYLKQLPIRLADRDKSADQTSAKDMDNFVNRRLSLQEELKSVATSHDKTVLQRQIDATDRQIDRLVYELYELTDEEIGIVEEATP